MRSGSATLIEEFGLSGPKTGSGTAMASPDRAHHSPPKPAGLSPSIDRPTVPTVGMLSADWATALASGIDVANTIIENASVPVSAVLPIPLLRFLQVHWRTVYVLEPAACGREPTNCCRR
jgi:hypothetical protein